MYENKKNKNTPLPYFKMQTHTQNIDDVPSVENISNVSGNVAKKRLVLKLKKENANNNIVPTCNEIETDNYTEYSGPACLIIVTFIYSQITGYN